MHPHHRRGIRRTAGLAALLLAATGAAGCSDSGGPADPATSAGASESDAPTSAAPQTEVSEEAQTGQPQPEPSDEVPAEVGEAATEGADGFADGLADALRNPDGGVGDIDVEGTALETLRSQAEEYERSGWRMRGRPVILWVEVYEHSDDRMVVGACIDNSRVKVVNQSGEVVSDGADTPPTLNILTLSPRGDDWVVSESTFPADPDCS